jgi:hypothetical protein
MKDPILKFFQIQLARIEAKPTAHSAGPKRPDLAKLDLGIKK